METYRVWFIVFAKIVQRWILRTDGRFGQEGPDKGNRVLA